VVLLLFFSQINGKEDYTLGENDSLASAQSHRRMQMKIKHVAVVLCMLLSLPSLAAKDAGFAVKYDGGTISDLKTGADIRINPSGATIAITDGKKDVLSIPAASITEISYGQDVHRRVGAAIGLAVISFGVGALMALTKSKKHFIGLTWATGDVKGGFAMQCDKNDYRGLLAALEGLTGKKAVDSDAMNVKN
jgi:hypothetical protein